MQLIVRGINGQPLCVSIDGASSIRVSHLKDIVHERTGVAVDQQRVVVGLTDLCDSHVISSAVAAASTIQVLLRIEGGKGGFGSLLRGGPAGVVQKKTTNFGRCLIDEIEGVICYCSDLGCWLLLGACRDLNGRRLRDTLNEKKLEQWAKEESQRELEQKALAYLKQQEREQRVCIRTTD
jgi:hypothetical protein